MYVARRYVDHSGQFNNLTHREALGLLREDETAALDLVAASREHGYDALVERALDKAQVALVFRRLDLHVYLPERTRAALALYGGERLAEDGDEDLLVVGLPEFVV